MISDKQFIDEILKLVGIMSVAYDDASADAPYGKGVKEAAEHVERLCKEFGMKVYFPEGKTLFAEIGDGDDIIGILGHIDVVPAGDNWTHNPLGEIVGDRLYGRGVIDDKGPTLAALFAMKDILDEKITLKHRIRIIFGMCEEVGTWSDIEYYKANEQLPVFGFTPDADFPAIYGEKGILHYELRFPKGTGIINISGGDAINMVPGWCDANIMGYGELSESGVCAHASLPEQGDNAIGNMMERLSAMGVEDPIVDFYQSFIGHEYDGSSMGCAFYDEQSGHLTLNPGIILVDEDDIVLKIDVRNPVTYKPEQVSDILLNRCEEYGATLKLLDSQKPVYMDKNGSVISTMVDVYREITGDTKSEPEVIGGGTYARAMNGIVAYGAMVQGRENTEHSPDEWIYKEDLIRARQIYKEALLRLDEL